MNLPLRLGALSAAPFALRRSSISWLHQDGRQVRSGEVIGYCNLRIEAAGRVAMGRPPFEAERTLQVAFAPKMDGRLRLAAATGGHESLDVAGGQGWDPEEIVAHLEPQGDPGPDGGSLRLLMLAGERMGWALDVTTGLVPGWNSLARGWWLEPAAQSINLLTLGVCDATGFIRGDHSGFVEMFSDARAPAHIAHATEHPAAPCARTILEQHERTPAQRQAVVEDIAEALASSGPTPRDLMFLSALATQLCQTPTRARYDIVTGAGLGRQPPPRAIVMSALSEPRRLLRHRRLGYHLQVYDHDRRAAGPMAKAWLKSAFEPVDLAIDDVQADLVRLSDLVRADTGARLLVVNRMSTSGHETISDYTPFDAPLERSLITVGAKTMNLMLEDLVAADKLIVLDLDALAADIGGGAHLPDGVHQDGRLQAALRTETLGIAEALAG
jgi:hypothetical protein